MKLMVPIRRLFMVPIQGGVDEANQPLLIGTIMLDPWSAGTASSLGELLDEDIIVETEALFRVLWRLDRHR